MGVHGLWELLAPVGRRVSVETLAGRKLPIDASIWMIQFVKAMRDERGEMVRNAHLLDFFRRICKLLFLRTKPSLSSTGAARERPGKDPQTAEKLLLYHGILDLCMRLNPYSPFHSACVYEVAPRVAGERNQTCKLRVANSTNPLGLRE